MSVDIVEEIATSNDRVISNSRNYKSFNSLSYDESTPLTFEDTSTKKMCPKNGLFLFMASLSILSFLAVLSFIDG